MNPYMTTLHDDPGIASWNLTSTTQLCRGSLLKLDDNNVGMIGYHPITLSPELEELNSSVIK